MQLAYRCTVDTAVNKTDRMPACFLICKGNIIGSRVCQTIGEKEKWEGEEKEVCNFY